MDDPEEGGDVDLGEPPEPVEIDPVDALHQAFNNDEPPQVFRGILETFPPHQDHRQVLLTLLHSAMAHEQLNLNVLRIFIAIEPLLACTADTRGCVLLHRACSFGVRVELVQFLLDSFPQAVCLEDYDGKRPLHRACSVGRDGCSIETVELLLSRFPKAIKAKDLFDMLPLHTALERNSSNEIITTLLDHFPEGALNVRQDGSNALHLACDYFVDPATIMVILRRLVQIHPKGARAACQEGRLPLHNACTNPYVSLEVVEFLLEQHPDGVHSRDRSGNVPLHYAAAHAPLDVVQLLIEKHPDAVTTTEQTGKLPLHAACAATSRHEIAELLLDSYIGAEGDRRGLGVADADGRLPIHYASNSLGGTETLLLVLREYKDGIYVADRNGMIPLHLACFSPRPSLERIQLLVEADLFTVVQQTHDGSTAFQLAWRMRRRHHDVEMYLVEKQDEAVIALKEAFDDVVDTQLGLPDLVAAYIWSFAKPYLWQPG